MYNSKSMKAEEFICHEEIEDTLAFADENRNNKEMIRQTQQLFDEMGLDISPRAMVSSLDASYKQIVEISRALMEPRQQVLLVRIPVNVETCEAQMRNALT